MASRFVRPELVTIPISAGDTLTVKRRLNHGERTAAYQRMYVAGADGQLRTNGLTAPMAMVLAYLVDWSFTDDGGDRVALRGKSIAEIEDTLNALDPEDFAELKAAIETHELAMLTERETEKKTRTAATPEPPISASPSGAAGALTGSVN